MKNLILVTVSGFFILGSFTGCGQGKKVIEHIELNSAIQDQSLWVEMDATLAKTQFSLPSLVLPLLDPNQPSRKLGELETFPNHVVIRVNVTEAARIPIADGSKLPNGTRIPLVLNNAKIVGIPVANSGSMVYVATLGQQIMVGAAINIRDLEPSTNAFNIFLPVQISDQISGMGGMYFGRQSGVGIFALKSSVPELVPELVSQLASESEQKSFSIKRFFAKKSRLISLNPSVLSKKKIEKLQNKTRHLRGVVSVE